MRPRESNRTGGVVDLDEADQSPISPASGEASGGRNSRWQRRSYAGV